MMQSGGVVRAQVNPAPVANRCRGLVVDITLKDVQTTLGKPILLREWVKVVRGVTEEFA